MCSDILRLFLSVAGMLYVFLFVGLNVVIEINSTSHYVKGKRKSCGTLILNFKHNFQKFSVT